jgi:phosphoribosylanthranilate isomerase
MRIKICGITKLEQGRSISKMGATDLGFICLAASPRYVNNRQLADLVPPLAPLVNCVGVFADATIATVVETAQIANFGSVQLHGQETLAYCQELRQQLGAIEIIKAWRIKSNEDLQVIDKYSPVVDTLLLDAYHPEALGGTGHTLDWPQLIKFRPIIPWLLAGGLKPDNVRSALSQLQPAGIDLSSGVEISPGNKDLAQVQRLFQALIGRASVED